MKRLPPVLIALALAGCGGARQAQWGYEGAKGPGSWGSLDPAYSTCSHGRNQSPIDLAGAQRGGLAPVRLRYRPVPVTVENTGHTLEVRVGPGSWVGVDGIRFDLVQFHFHAPSEHTLAGKRFPIELHLVNRSGDGRIAVLGVLIASGPENPDLDGLLAAAPAQSGEERELHGRLNPANLVPGGEAYRYRGSLTMPPCTENVRWTVFAQPLTLSPGEIQAFTRLYRGDNRPLQPLNGRGLFRVG